jgi:hypothetical protein
MLSSTRRCAVLVGLLALLPLGCGGGEKSNPKTQDEKREKQGESAGTRTPNYTLIAEEWSHEFVKSRPGEADNKYRNQLVELTGEVAWVRSKGGDKDVEVSLKGHKWKQENAASYHVIVRFRPEFAKRALELSSGQKVKALGKYDPVYGVPGLSDATLEELSKSAVVMVTAADLINRLVLK